jgi:hypothetical protein
MINFPAAPVAGQIFFASNGAVYQYNSTYTSWLQIASTVLQDGTFQASASGSQFAPSVISTWETANPTVTLGNVGGWYNATTGVYTPPAGRYYLYGQITYFSSSAAMFGELRWRKNGVVIPNSTVSSFSPGANQNTPTNCAVIVDANGTDTFELQVQSSVLMSFCVGTMGAFPLSQAAAIPGGGSSWRQIARTVVAAPQADLTFQNIPTDVNDIELNFDLTPVNNAVDIVLQWYDGAGVLLNTSYGFTLNMNTNGQALGTAPFVFNNISAGGITTGIIMDYAAGGVRVNNGAVGGIRGTVRMNNIRDAARPKSVRFQTDYLSDDTATFRSAVGSGWRGVATAVTGFRLLFGTGNIAAGGSATLWGSP